MIYIVMIGKRFFEKVLIYAILSVIAIPIAIKEEMSTIKAFVEDAME